jgi:hypothetical protein
VVFLWDYFALAIVMILWIGGFTSLFASEFALRRRVEIPTHCVRCSYNLDGLPASSPCPECGTLQSTARREMRRTTPRRWFLSALCAYPSGILMAVTTCVLADVSASSIVMTMGFSYIAIFAIVPYFFVHCGALAVGRYQSDRVVCILATSASGSALIVHVFLALAVYVWDPDPFAILATMFSKLAVFPACGYGMLIAAHALARRRA